jgi:hypothetical protein
MKSIKLALLSLSIFSLNAFATGSFFCKEYDTQTGQTIDDGMYIAGVYSWSFGNALVGKVKMSDPGHTDIPLNMSQYKNNEDELYYLSVMDLSGVPGEQGNQRVVLLDAKRSATPDESFVGTLNISYTHFSGYNIPVMCWHYGKK